MKPRCRAPWRGPATKGALAVVVCSVLASCVIGFGGVRLAVDSPVTWHSLGSLRLVESGPSLASPGYRAIVGASVGLGTGLFGILALHLLVATAAAIRLLHLGRALGGTGAGVTAVCLFTLNPDQIRWHAYLLPDSLYTSVLILTVASLHDAWLSPTPRRFTAAMGCGIGAGTLNATGYLLLPIILASGLVKWGLVHDVRWIVRPTILAGFVCLILMLPAVREGALIPTSGQPPPERGIVVRDYQESWLPMPAETGRPGLYRSSGLAYAARHPRATIHLASLRVLAVLAHVRPYYAPRHNLALLGVLAPLYTLAAVGLRGARRQPLATLLVAVIVAHLVVIALTCSDWDGRSLSLALPLIGLLAARGLVTIRLPCRAILSLGVLAILAVLFHGPILTSLALQFRVDNPAPSDALVLLLGGDRGRPRKAAELYQSGMGPMVLVGSDPDLELNRHALIEDGVAPSDIFSLGPIIGTREEAWRVRDYVKRHPEIRTITIVTTAFHTARASWTFRRALSGTGVEIHAAASDDPRFDETDWFASVDGVRAYSQEILKFTYSFLCNISECPLTETELRNR